MPSDRDDAPPREALEALAETHYDTARVLLDVFGIPKAPELDVPLHSTPQWCRDTERFAMGIALLRTRSFSDAAAWALAAWIVAGREPTREMRDALLAEHSENGPEGTLTAALAAAREAGDG